MSENKKFIPLSGTFLDAIACDIPSNNWTPDIWEREFVRYNEIGIDEAYLNKTSNLNNGGLKIYG